MSSSSSFWHCTKFGIKTKRIARNIFEILAAILNVMKAGILLIVGKGLIGSKYLSSLYCLGFLMNLKLDYLPSCKVSKKVSSLNTQSYIKRHLLFENFIFSLL